MSWTGPTSGIRVSGRSPACAPVRYTSISVVWVQGCCPDGSSSPTRTLRMYGARVSEAVAAMGFAEDGCTPLSESAMNAIFAPYGERSSCTGDAPGRSGFEYVAYDEDGGPLPDGRVQYIDAIVNDKGEYEFWLLSRSERAADAPLLRSTCIPEHRTYSTFYYHKYGYNASGATTVIIPKVVSKPALTFCEGLDVLRLPNGLWVMLLQSWTVLVDDDLDLSNLTYGEIRERAGFSAHCSLTDIVCYVADDADFNVNVRGPFWVVDGKRALPEEELPPVRPGPRLYVGVPSGVVRGSDLYVYYTVDEAHNFDDREGNREVDPDTDRPFECPENTVGGDYSGDDDSSRTAYVDALNSFRAGVAVKRIALEDLYAHVDLVDTDSGLYVTANQLWDYLLVNWRWDVTVPGTLLGRVRVWVEPNPAHEAEPAAEAESFEDAFCGPDGKLIDPDAVTCADGVTASLYFAYSACTSFGIGGGLWRATGLPDGDTFNDINGLRVEAVLGKDFYVVVDWADDGSWTSADHLADADNDFQFLNPAAIRMLDGAWRVYSGGGIDFVQMNRFDGSSADGGCA